MTALDHRTHATVAGAPAAAVVTRMADGLRTLMRALWRRRELNRLAELSDHALADIGLTRADLAEVRRLSAAVDPTLRLDVIVRGRFYAEDRARRL